MQKPLRFILLRIFLLCTVLLAGNFAFAEKLTDESAYSPDITDAKGCSASLTSNNVCSGTAPSLTATGNGGTANGYRYDWSANTGVAFSTGQATPKTITVTPAPAAGTYTYSVTVTNSAGCTASKDVTVTVYPKPTANAGTDKFYCSGGSAVSIGSASVAGNSYSWSPTTNLSPSATVSNPTANPAATTTYVVTVTDGNTCTATDDVVVTVVNVTASAAPTLSSVCPGSSTTVVATPGGGAGASYNYNWSSSVPPSPNPVSGSATVTVTPTAVTTYTVTVTDPTSGCSNTATATVSVGGITANITGTLEICKGKNTTLTATPSAGTDYTWKDGVGTTISTGPTDNITVSPTVTTTYNVTVTGSGGCTASKTVTVIVDALPTADAGTDQSICTGTVNIGGAPTASGGTSPYTSYTWTNGASAVSNPSVSPAATTTYNVMVTDSKGCTATDDVVVNVKTVSVVINPASSTACPGASTLLTATTTVTPAGGTDSYSWAASSGAAPTGNPVTVTPTVNTTYTVTVTNTPGTGCTATATAVVTMKSISANLATDKTNICPGQSANLTVTPSGTTGSETITWGSSPAYGGALAGTTPTVSPTVTTTFNVTVTDGTCTASATVTVTVDPVPTPNPADKSICKGTSATLDAGTGASFAWSSGGTGQTESVSPTVTTTYTVTVSNGSGCTGTADAIVTVWNNPVASAGQDVTICSGKSTPIGGAPTGTAGTGAITTYLWTPAGTYTPNNADPNPTVSPAVTTLYTVKVTDANGCTATDDINVTVNTPPTLNEGPDVNICPNESKTIGVAATGGTAPLTYVWSSHLNNVTDVATPTATGIVDASYTVTVTDFTGCTATDNINVHVPTQMTLVSSPTDATCGSCNGKDDISISGGTPVPAYTVAWPAPIASSANVTGLCAGAYDVTVTDGTGCTATITVSINAVGGPTATILPSDVVNVTCAGHPTGSLKVTGSGSPGPYTYQWGPLTGNQTTQTATNLGPGTYSVSVYDAATPACPGITTGTITGPTPLTVTAISTPPSCAGSADATATATAGGGSGAWTYSWTGGPPAPVGAATSHVTGLAAPVTYTVVVADAADATCTVSTTVTISDPVAISASISAKTDVKCNAACDGTATVSATGASGSYLYDWGAAANNQTTTTATGLCVGSYTVTVSDFNNTSCSTTVSVTITEPTVVAIAQGALTNPACGLTNGSTCVNISGGTPSYTVSAPWTIAGSTACVNNVGSGTYTVTVTDGNSCTATFSSTLSNLGGPTISATATAVSIPGACDGTANVTIAPGGNPPFTYLWDNGDATATTNPTLCQGTHCVTVTDVNGCQSNACADVTAPPLLTVSAVKTDESCFGSNDGTATATATGGVAPITYNWTGPNGPKSGAAITGCAQGVWTVTVGDASGQTATKSVTVGGATSAVTVSIVKTDILCFGLCTGSEVAKGVGGTKKLGAKKYDYVWAGSAATDSLASGLCAGAYSVTITDKAGCTASATASVTEPTKLNATATKTKDVSCAGYTDGCAQVIGSGGTPGYTYLWTPSAKTTASICALGAGVNNVVVTDSRGCTASGTVSLTAPTSISWGNSSGISPSCPVGQGVSNNGTGSVLVTSTGHNITGWTWPAPAVVTPPTVQTGSSATGLTPGSYTVTVTYKPAGTVACTATAPVVDVAPIPDLTVPTTSTVPPQCNGSSGSATVNDPTGGNPGAFTYSWGAPVSQTTATATIPTWGSGATSPVYKVTVTDSKSCTISTSVTLTQPSALAGTSNPDKNVTCNGGNDGEATVSVNAGSGTSPYTYNWSGGVASCTAIPGACAKTGLTAGTYTVTVSDFNLCTMTKTVTLTQPATFPSAVVGTITDANCNGAANGSATVTGSGGTSTPAYTYAWSGGTPTGNGSTVTGLAGSEVGLGTAYTVTITDGTGVCSTTQVINIKQPVPFNITTGSTKACAGLADGTITFTAAGGANSGLYDFIFQSPIPAQNSATTATVSGLTANTYNVTITDATLNTCSTTSSVTITDPALLVATASLPAGPICDLSSTSLTLDVTGGTFAAGSGNYVWDDGASGTIASSPYNNTDPSNNVTNPTTSTWTKTYTVTVTDDKGCTASSSANIDVLAPKDFTPNVSKTDICNNTNTSVNLTISGLVNVTNPTFTWTNPGPVDSYTGAPKVTVVTPTVTTTYTLEVNDVCGPKSKDIVVTVHPAPIRSILPFKGSCTPARIYFNADSLSDPNTEPGVQYQWTVSGNTPTTLNGNNQSGVFDYANAGNNEGLFTYTLLASYTAAPGLTCSASATNVGSFYSYQIPMVNISGSKESVTDFSPEATFTAYQMAGDYTTLKSWDWNFGDPIDNKGNVNSPTVSHIYSAKGTYPVTVKVMSDNGSELGCPATAELNQTVVEVSEMWIPDAFTPNGDGKNDLFQVVAKNVKDFEMIIFDRWGNKIYELHDVNGGWDGKAHQGAVIAQEDVYIYQIIYTDYLNKRHAPIVGRVALIR